MQGMIGRGFGGSVPADNTVPPILVAHSLELRQTIEILFHGAQSS